MTESSCFGTAFDDDDEIGGGRARARTRARERQMLGGTLTGPVRHAFAMHEAARAKSASGRSRARPYLESRDQRVSNTDGHPLAGACPMPSKRASAFDARAHIGTRADESLECAHVVSTIACE